jgi:hypothetical protein
LLENYRRICHGESHGILSKLLWQIKRASRGKYGEQFVDKWWNQIQYRKGDTMKINKKILLLIAAVICITAILYPITIKGRYYSEIPINQVPNILRIYNIPAIPEWEAKSVKKYDDGFTTPTVHILYKNNITLMFSTVETTFKDFNKENSIRIGDKQITVYYKNKKFVYVFYYNNLYYSFIFTDDNEENIHKFIKTLI